jgi:hypothetical protein
MKTYNWKITLIKGLKIGVEVFITGLLAMHFDNPVFLAAVPLLEMFLNWLKNKDNWIKE